MPSWERGFDPRARENVWVRDWAKNPFLGTPHTIREGIRPDGLPFTETLYPNTVYRDGRKLFPNEYIQKR